MSFRSFKRWSSLALLFCMALVLSAVAAEGATNPLDGVWEIQNGMYYEDGVLRGINVSGYTRPDIAIEVIEGQLNTIRLNGSDSVEFKWIDENAAELPDNGVMDGG